MRPYVKRFSYLLAASTILVTSAGLAPVSAETKSASELWEQTKTERADAEAASKAAEKEKIAAAAKKNEAESGSFFDWLKGDPKADKMAEQPAAKEIQLAQVDTSAPIPNAITPPRDSGSASLTRDTPASAQKSDMLSGSSAAPLNNETRPTSAPAEMTPYEPSRATTTATPTTTPVEPDSAEATKRVIISESDAAAKIKAMEKKDASAQSKTAPTGSLAPVSDAGLKNAMEAAYNSNPRLKAQRDALRAVDEGVAQAVSGFRPSVVGSYDKGRVRGKAATASSDAWRYSPTESKELTVSQPLFNGGSTIAQINAARNRSKAGRYQLLQAEQDTMLEVVQSYMDVVQNKAVLELSRNNVSVLGQQLKATQDRFDVGEVTRTDVAQSQSRQSRSRSDMSSAEGEYAASRAQFERVTGFVPGDLVMPEGETGVPATLEEAIDIAMKNNPDLKSVNYQEKAAKSDINSRVGALLPSVALQGQMIREEDANVRAGVATDVDALTVNVNVPLYQSGAEYSRIREAKARYQQRVHDSIDTHHVTRENVTKAWERYLANKQSIVSYSDAITAARTALDGVTQEQQYGARTTLDVLDAEQELFLAQVNLVRAQRNEKVAYYNLLAILGRLNAKDLGLNVELYDPEDNYDLVKWLPIGF